MFDASFSDLRLTLDQAEVFFHAVISAMMPVLPRRAMTFRTCLILCGMMIAGCSGSTASQSPPASVADQPPVAARKFNFTPAEPKQELKTEAAVTVAFPQFRDVAEERGIHFIYDNGASPKALMVESTGGGCGWFDYDLDGRLDLFLPQGGVPDAPPDAPRPPDSLWRQAANQEFIDVTPLAGVGDRGFGQGLAIGDLNNDGFDDLFVTNAGRCSLYLNQGDGTFRQAIDLLAGKRDVWSTSAAWGDPDRDGDLDLYVCNYTIYDAYAPIPCFDKSGERTICHPAHVDAEPDEYFVNQGDGTFVESSQTLGLFGSSNKGLGVVIADLTGDEWPEIFVANDVSANFLFVNEAGQSFKESALVLGGAYSATGESQANMGIAFGDYDHNGWQDLCITHFTGEGHTLYQNLGPLGLQDVTAQTGLREATMSKLGFGTIMSDFNLDGFMDVVFTSGHIDPRFRNLEGYEMTPQQFTFDGVRWRDGSAAGGEYFQRRAVGRGMASADYDRDGDLDLCVVHQNSPVALLQNESQRSHCVRVAPIGVVSNRNGYGARLTLHFGDQHRKAEVAGGTSYVAANERLVFFGLGDWSGPCRLEVVWPSGMTDSVELDHPDELVVVREGQGRLPTIPVAD